MFFEFYFLSDVLQDSILSVQVYLELRNEADIDVSTCVGCLDCDKASISAHESHKADSIVDSSALDVGGPDGSNGLADCCFEAKRFVDDGNIVVDSFGDTGDSHLGFSLLEFFAQGQNSSMGAVSTDNIELVDTFLLYRVDYFFSVEPSS